MQGQVTSIRNEILKFVQFAALVITAIGISGSTRTWAGTEKVLYSFTGGSDGDTPYANVVGRGGNLYGTTQGGGAFGCGTVFEVKNSNGHWTEHVLYSFLGGSDGCNPYGNGVIFDKLGNIYGATWSGGANGRGTVYRLQKASNIWTETVLYNFTGGADGGGPFGGLILDSAGNLYGSTHDGGTYNWGTIFEMSPSGNTWTENVLHSFSAVPDGFWPEDPLFLDQAGNLWSETYEGGTGGGGFGYGMVFELTPSNGSWTENVIHSFDLTDGEWPHGGVVHHSGSWYGTTYYDGSGSCNGLGCGLVYQLKYSSKNGWQETVLYHFAGSNDAAGPFARLVFDNIGNMYGATYYGGGSTACTYSSGSIGCGTVYELTPSGNTWTEKVLYAFSGGTDGSRPTFNSGSLVMDKLGNLYGTTSEGGAYGHGTVFEVTP